ncbi:hypothetical protein WN943_021943 [Citrus x changshan-huyou]
MDSAMNSFTWASLKRAKNEDEAGEDANKRELVQKEKGQEYAQVIRMLRNGRCKATCTSGTRRLCHR